MALHLESSLTYQAVQLQYQQLKINCCQESPMLSVNVGQSYTVQLIATLLIGPGNQSSCHHPDSSDLQAVKDLSNLSGCCHALASAVREADPFSNVLQADKHAITQQLGVQLRDLRLLDPQLHFSYPSALLCRDKALVVNLEHIKCIITKDEVLILNADEENVVSPVSLVIFCMRELWCHRLDIFWLLHALRMHFEQPCGNACCFYLFACTQSLLHT